jgi:hypothetical protein
LLVTQAPSSRSESPLTTRSDSYFSSQRRSLVSTAGRLSSSTPQQQIASFVIARDLDRAPPVVQIQVLELLRTGRIFTRTSVQAVPKPFIFIPALAADSGGQARVARHLNDFFYVAHWHDPEDGFVNLEEADASLDHDSNSTGSVLQRSPGVAAAPPTEALISTDVRPTSTHNQAFR